MNVVSPADAITDQPVRIKFKWLHDAAYVNYEVEFDTLIDFSSSAKMSIADGVDYSALNAADTITQLDSNFYFGKTYYWRVRGINGNITSSWSTVYSFTIRSAPLLTSPVDGSVLNVFNVLFRCEAILGATQYRFQGGNTTVFISPIYNHVITASNYSILDKSSVGYFVNSITTNGDYYVRVQAISYVDSSAWSNVAKFTFEVSNSVEEVNLSSNSLYPNPSLGMLNIKQEGVTQLVVFNMAGEEVFRTNSNAVIKTVDLSQLSDGMYQVLLFSGEKLYAQKVSVIR